MKGIILAGGEGTRLRPLTCDCPKPMIRLMGRPVLQYALELFRGHGITEVAATLGYRSDAIVRHFGDGEGFGVRLEYFVERTPLGTAGGVRQAKRFLDETFVVLSGDAVTDLDISRAAAFHRAHGALATLVLKHADNPPEYGVVDLDPEGRVRGFHEKPSWAEVTGDLVNTGIYLLEPEVLDAIPGGRPCDFGHELFPRLVAEGRPVFGCVTSDYWCDVGDVRTYIAAHADAMEGRIHLESLPGLAGHAVVRPGADVDRAALLEGPCLIEPGAKVGAGATIGPYSYVGADCAIGEGASIKRGILWPGARLGRKAQARGCVLASGASLGEEAQAYEECVLGTRARLDARGVLLSGAKLWPGKRVFEGERLETNRVWGGRQEPQFASGRFPVASPADALRAAQACAAALRPREVLIGHGGRPADRALWHAAAAGAMAQGARVIDAGACALPILRHAQRALGADAALLLESGAMTPLNGRGALLPGKVQRAVAQLHARQDFPAPADAPSLPALSTECVESAYIAAVAARFAADATSAAPVALFCENVSLRSAAEQALRRIGLKVRVCADPDNPHLSPDELGMALDCGGETCALFDANGRLAEARMQLLAAWCALELEEKALILPADATRGVEALARRYAARVEYVPGERARWMNALAERSPLQLDLQFDGLMLAVTALSLLTKRGLRLSEWQQSMPEIHLRTRALSLPTRQCGRVLQALSQSHPEATLEGGMRLQRDGGWAWIGADEGRPQMRIVTEGASEEFAQELCDFCERELKQVIHSGTAKVAD